jgi:hypothetical protein
MFGGSWTQNFLEIADGLLQSPLYNITIIGSYELKEKV